MSRLGDNPSPDVQKQGNKIPVTGHYGQILVATDRTKYRLVPTVKEKDNLPKSKVFVPEEHDEVDRVAGGIISQPAPTVVGAPVYFSESSFPQKFGDQITKHRSHRRDNLALRAAERAAENPKEVKPAKQAEIVSLPGSVPSETEETSNSSILATRGTALWQPAPAPQQLAESERQQVDQQIQTLDDLIQEIRQENQKKTSPCPIL